MIPNLARAQVPCCPPLVSLFLAHAPKMHRDRVILATCSPRHRRSPNQSTRTRNSAHALCRSVSPQRRARQRQARRRHAARHPRSIARRKKPPPRSSTATTSRMLVPVNPSSASPTPSGLAAWLSYAKLVRKARSTAPAPSKLIMFTRQTMLRRSHMRRDTSGASCACMRGTAADRTRCR